MIASYTNDAILGGAHATVTVEVKEFDKYPSNACVT